MNIPKQIFAGDSVTWFDYPTTNNAGITIDSAEWTLTYQLRGPAQITKAAVADGSGWRTQLTTTDTTIAAGVYYWQAIASKAADRFTLGTGQVEFKPNLAVSLPSYDGRSQARKDLEAVQAAMRAMIAGGGVQAYTIAGRSLQKMSMADLMTFESKLKVEVNREEKANALANGLPNPNNIFVRFR